MPARKNTTVTLSKAGDWIDWYDALLDLAREHDLEDLVDIEKKRPVSEILLPKPETPNPLALFPKLLDEIPPAARQQVEKPVLDIDGVAVDPPQHTLIRHQAVEDDALVHLSNAQAAGWKTRLNMYNHREREWRSQQRNVLLLRRWIDKHVDPVFAYLTREAEGDREAVEALRGPFPDDEEEFHAEDEYRDITQKAGQGLEVAEWFRQWRLGHDRARRLKVRKALDPRYAGDYFLQAIRCYYPNWAMSYTDLFKAQRVSLVRLLNEFHHYLEYKMPRLRRERESPS